MKKLWVRQKNKFFYPISIAICLILLLSINSIVSLFSPFHTSIMKTEKHSVRQFGSSVILGLDSVYTSTALTQDIQISGWAYISSSGASNSPSDKVIILYLVSPEGLTYKIDTSITQRLTMGYYIEEGYEVAGDFHAFVAQFPTIAIKNGAYSLYAYIKESDGSEAIQQTDDVFVKSSDGLTYSHTSFTYDEILLPSSRAVIGGIDSISSIESYLVNILRTPGIDCSFSGAILQGHIVCEQRESSLGRAYAKVTLPDGTTNIFPAYQKTFRQDTADKSTFSKKDLLSGCAFLLPQEFLLDFQQITIQILLFYPLEHETFFSPPQVWELEGTTWSKQ